MRKSIFIVCLVVILSSIDVVARENTTRRNLVKTNETEVVVDSIWIDDISDFKENVVIMKGYSKRAGATKETFMLVNNSNMHISLVEFLFRYNDMSGNVFHERAAEVKCDLPPYSSRQVSIKTFDEGGKFYYYKSKQGRDAIAYDLKIKLQRYDIKVVRK